MKESNVQMSRVNLWEWFLDLESNMPMVVLHNMINE